ncbi:unnamed protein product [Paramecium pentaurelia]|uniref:CRC domain-containing protein n=1 Tax=Paramecium pentaurelia TaxID=43138 RepID=A0A8S1TZU5_9CILI|nr:unnamed protein product [Paramecium pentaurelia]
MSSINQEAQLRKHSDVTAVFQNQFNEYELDQYFDNIPPPALQKYRSNFSEQDFFINEKLQNTNDYDQEQELGISINSNQDEEKHQTTSFHQFELININNQKNNVKEKRNRKKTHYNEFFDYDVNEYQQSNSPCKCNKSHCLLLYCTCFHKNIECSEKCQCHDCHNNQDYSQIRKQALEKVKIKQQRLKNDDDLFDKTTIWGCQCKKSQCKKNYCECFIRNKKCSSLCKCNNCQNKKRIPNFKKIMKSKY